jgi:hypothetical protein
MRALTLLPLAGEGGTKRRMRVVERSADETQKRPLIPLRDLNSHHARRSPCGQHSLLKTAVLPFGLSWAKGTERRRTVHGPN